MFCHIKETQIQFHAEGEKYEDAESHKGIKENTKNLARCYCALPLPILLHTRCVCTVYPYRPLLKSNSKE